MIKTQLLKNKVILKSLQFLHARYWDVVMQFWRLLPASFGSTQINKEFSIGIVTYVDRYERFFKPLITNLVKIFPDTEFIISVNGYYERKIQDEYLKDINAFLGKFRNVKVVDFVEPQSLSKLWNLCILNSSTQKTFIFNDDIKIKTSFRKDLENSGILKEEIALINRSWSHFLISKETVVKNGWFDQRFPGVGNEDEDYEARLVINKIKINTFRIYSLKNIVFLTSNFSYGKDIDTVNTKYVKQNKIFFDSKWDLTKVNSPSYHYVEILNGYIKLKEGMDTPFFYDPVLLTKENLHIIKS